MPEGINMRFSARCVEWCLAHGVAEVVLCAGARNLALVATWLAVPGVRCWHFPEERSAAFFALGRIQAGAGPVAVVVTSGTAAAELLPAAIEAHYQGLPLVLITADRPRHYRGSAAPQAIEQAGLFGAYAPTMADLAADDPWPDCSWLAAAPVHLNLCFDEPVSDGPVVFMRNACKVGFAGKSETAAVPVAGDVPDWGGFGAGEKMLVLVGKLAPEEVDPVRRLLCKLAAPVWLESTSNLLGCSDLQPYWTRNAENVAACGATHVLRLGGVPCTRFWRDLEGRVDISVRSVSRQGWSGLGRRSETWRVDLARADEWRPAPGADARWWAAAGPGQAATAHFQFPVNDVKILSKKLREKEWIEYLSHLIPVGSRVFLGNSLPIREWQEVGAWRPGLTFYANRGANGIDGELSTFFGLAEGVEEAWGIFGDLTVLYDLAAPWILRQLREKRLRVVVVNNGGGAIFSGLPAFAEVGPEVRRVVMNRHGLDFSAWAAFWGVPCVRVQRVEDLVDLPDGPVVIEIRPVDAMAE